MKTRMKVGGYQSPQAGEAGTIIHSRRQKVMSTNVLNKCEGMFVQCCPTFCREKKQQTSGVFHLIIHEMKISMMERVKIYY